LTTNTLAYLLSINIFLAILLYLVLNLLYSSLLKHIVIVDVLVISTGYLLRIAVGGLAVEAQLSSWIVLCTLFISLFLGFGKRRSELITFRGSPTYRAVLQQYSVSLLDYIIVITATLTIVTYSLYTIDARSGKALGATGLIYTLPFVIYGIFKYLYQLFKNRQGCDPADILLQDKTILIDIVLWIVTVVLILCFQ